MRRRLFAAALTSAALICAPLLGAPPAAADMAQPRVVSANPVDFTPHVVKGTVWALAVVGDTVVVGGSFEQVQDHARTTTYNRKNIFAYGLRDGAIRSFAPTVDGAVYALSAGTDGTVYTGGSFRTVNGTSQRGLARLRLSDSTRVSGFTAKINWGDVRALAVRGSRLYAGGTFSAVNGVTRVGLARLNTTSGAVDSGFDAKLSAPGLSRTRVEHFDVSPDGTRLVAIGALLKVGTAARTQIAMFNTSGANAAVMSWYTDTYKAKCKDVFDTYLRQVKFSPDGSYFVVTATGQAASPTLPCDAAARFNTAGGGKHNPVWIQRTGGDSLYGVAVTGSAVYVGGHQRYMDNPYGTDDTGPGKGAVKREGIGAINPTTGKTMSWNPGRERGEGVRVFQVVPNGLIVGSDTDHLGGEYHGSLGMFPI
ncbi:delta-60 repeat domain-containing protein [Winogradskya humida]|uniref:Delta-60 repeat protein n=1 Tax=Winogradskya humida TaxID=113566 RepID=A0ABQ4A3H8_9ACTN|nr:delta-60 repeat domain-containing protein [Actinoplanes humidus]GIE25410.1 hypothetical protein Ahu01nite_085120 [Actinoplanes humidus]